MKIIVLRFEGGLGNQLFQYAFAKTLQSRYGGKILADLHTYSKDKQRVLSLNHFMLNEKVYLYLNSIGYRAALFCIRAYSRLFHRLLSVIGINIETRIKVLCFFGIFIQETSTYQNYMHKCISPIIFIAGNWMSEKFFIESKSQIIKELKIITPISNHNDPILRRIRESNAVCVHIRRGDYLDEKIKINTYVCDFSYYKKAIQYISDEQDDPVFFIFSNSAEDINWIKNNYNFDVPVIYVNENNKDYEDFCLMTECKHFILSNSTYSWWVSYLSSNSNKIVVSPSRWNNGIWDQSDIFIPNWKIINV